MSDFMAKAPIVFCPLYKERVWGGRHLETVYGRRLPGEKRIGESWELVDRPGEESVVASGPFEGKTLHKLWTQHRREVFGEGQVEHVAERFPLLIKILDAADDLSIQVHPPDEVAAALGGEPKTEMWCIARAEPGARLYVGLKAGVGRVAFEAGIADGRTREQVHAIEPRSGEFIFIPSGRLHAIGAGLLIYEIQQNSDTTFRVYDWDRVGIDGRPRELHVEESLKCIDFEDVEPAMGKAEGEQLVDCLLFQVRRRQICPDGFTSVAPDDAAVIVAVVSGCVVSGGECFREGDFFLVPAQAEDRVKNLAVKDGRKAEVLLTWLPAPGIKTGDVQ